MITINKNKFLTYKNKIYKCSIGINGLNNNKIEGDGCTPVGTFSIGELYVRTDRIKNINTNLNYIKITKKMAWSDNPKDKYYNCLINSNINNTETFYRKDNIYNIILIIKYNMNPTIPFKGSAIFIHIQKNNYSPTKGCIALDLKDFTEILATLKTSDRIKILNN